MKAQEPNVLLPAAATTRYSRSSGCDRIRPHFKRQAVAGSEHRSACLSSSARGDYGPGQPQPTPEPLRIASTRSQKAKSRRPRTATTLGSTQNASRPATRCESMPLTPMTTTSAARACRAFFTCTSCRWHFEEGADKHPRGINLGLPRRDTSALFEGRRTPTGGSKVIRRSALLVVKRLEET